MEAPIYKQGSKKADVGIFGLLASDLKECARLHCFTEIAQFYRLVHDGLILTRHIFQGLQRPLYCDGNPSSDQDKLIYTRKPTRDYEWNGGKAGSPARRGPPKGCVFTVLISPNGNKHADTFPTIDGWIEHWTWVDEDDGLAEAPSGWVDRYNRKLWTLEEGQ